MAFFLLVFKMYEVRKDGIDGRIEQIIQENTIIKIYGKGGDVDEEVFEA